MRISLLILFHISFLTGQSVWTEQQKLSTGVASGSFGAVAIEGDYALVGANNESNGGAVYVYKRSGESWTQQERLTAINDSTGDWFGMAVSMAEGWDDPFELIDYTDAAARTGYGSTAWQTITTHATKEAALYWIKLKLMNQTAFDCETSLDIYSTDNSPSSANANNKFTGTPVVSSRTVTISANSGATVVEFGFPNYVILDPNTKYYIQGNDCSNDNASLSVYKNSDAGIQAEKSGAAGNNWGRLYHTIKMQESVTYAVIGAGHDDDKGQNAGAAYVFKRSGNTWSQMDRLHASDGLAGDNFGHDVQISGNFIIVGASGYGDKTKTGKAYFFKRDNQDWNEIQSFTASDAVAGDRFGHHLDLEGDYAIIGAELHADSSGAAYIFKFSDGKFDQQAKLTDTDGANGDWFGHHVAINGEYAITGSEYSEISNDLDWSSGSAFIFKRSGNTWARQAVLTPKDSHKQKLFGDGVSINGDFAAVGAWGDYTTNGYGSGAVYMFERDGTDWTEYQKLTASDGKAGDGFGLEFIEIDGDYIIIGAYRKDSFKGGAYIFKNVPDDGPPVISSVALATDNSTIAVTINEAVYNTSGGSGDLETSDFSFSLSGGTATLSSPTPTSISKEGNVYTLGIGISGITSGTEVLTVNPVDNGIYDAAGNEASTIQSNNTATLNDISPPTVVSVSSSTDDGLYKLADAISIQVTFSEKVNVTGTPQMNLETGSNDGVANYSGGTGSTILSFNYTVYNDHVSSDLDYQDTTSLTLNGGTINDLASNVGVLTLPAPGATNSLGANKALVIDGIIPTITNIEISADNTKLTLTYSEAIFNSASGTGDLEAADFEMSVSSGNAALASNTPSSISSDGKVYTLGVNFSSLADGTDTLWVNAVDNSVYDLAGNEASTGKSSIKLNDRLPPSITATVVSGQNNILLVTVSEPIYNSSIGSGTVENSDFKLSLSEGSTKLASNSPISISKMDNIIDDEVYSLIISYSVNSNGGDTLTINPVDDGIYDKAGNEADTTQSNNFAVLSDVFDPIIVSSSIASDNSTITIEMNENVYNTSSGSGALEVGDFKFSMTGGTAVLLSSTPTSIAADGKKYTLGLSTAGYAYGSEKVTVNPVTGSIFDLVGNIAKTSQDSNVVTLNETTPPVINGLSISSDNNSLFVSMSEPVFNTNGGSGDLETGDFILKITDGTATLLDSTPVSITADQNAYTLGLNLSGTADGNEKLTIYPLDDSIYDAAGNEADTIQSINTVKLYDLTPPVVNAVSEPPLKVLPILEKSTIELFISEPISSLNVSAISQFGDTLLPDYSIINKDTVLITLNPPFISGDSVVIKISDLTDLSSNVGSRSEYKYEVSFLGDFNLDGGVDIYDFNSFVTGWEQKDLKYELGPVTRDEPNFKPNLDGVFNARDGMVFYRMWHWNYDRAGKLRAKIYPRVGESLKSEVNRDQIVFIPPKGSYSSEIIINYLPGDIYIEEAYGERENEMPMTLTKEDTLSGYLLTNQINVSNHTIPFKINNRDADKTSIEISYRYFNKDHELISAGYEEMILSPVPESFELHQNYPNPFNPITTIRYDLPQEGHVLLTIYDILGREVAQLVNQRLPAGYHKSMWNAKNSLGISISGGIYFYQIQTRDYTKTNKMVLLK